MQNLDFIRVILENFKSWDIDANLPLTSLSRGHSQQVERAENRFYFVVSAAHRLQTSRVVLCGYKETLGNNRRLK